MKRIFSIVVIAALMAAPVLAIAQQAQPATPTPPAPTAAPTNPAEQTSAAKAPAEKAGKANAATITEALLGFVNRIAKYALPIATAMAAVGVLSMAVIQAIKDTSPVRHAFQKRFLRRWLLRRTENKFGSKGIHGLRDPLRRLPPGAPGLAQVSTAEEDLVRLATGGDDMAFYDLAIEQLCGQMNAAAQLALEYPQRHKELLSLLAAQAKPEDLSLVLNPPPFEPGKEADPKVGEYRDARNRVSHHIQRSIDGLQIAAGFRWKFYLQIVSFIASFLIAFMALLMSSQTKFGLNTLVTALLVGIVAGFVAPIARDLVAALQQLRK